MPRDILMPVPNRGLSLVRPRSLIGPSFCHRAENVELTPTSVRRRRGRLIAYNEDHGSAVALTALKRFYNLATSGTIAKKFLRAVGGSDPLWVADGDWDDDTQTPQNWTELDLPNAGDNTLYETGYGSGPIDTTGANIRFIVASKSWAYVIVEAVAADDTNDKRNVPLRTQGEVDSVYLHGLVPPASLDVADTEGQSSAPGGILWTGVEAIANDVSRISKMVKAPDGRYFFAFIDTSSVLKLAERATDGTWTSETVTGSLVVDTTADNRTFDIAVDSNSNPSIIFVEDTSFDLHYAWRIPDTTTWTVEDVDTAVNYEQCAIDFDPSNEPHVLCKNGSNETRAFIKADGTWTATPGEAVSTAGNTGNYVSVAVDSDGNTHACWYESTLQNLEYNVRTSGSWGTSETVDGTNRKGQECSIALDSSDVPHISYIEDQTGAPYDLWYSHRTGGSWSGNNEEVLANVYTGGITVAPVTQMLLGVGDSLDVPIIAFYYREVNNYGLAMKEGGAWATGEIEQQYSNAEFLSLVVDDDTTFSAALIEPSPSTGFRAIFLTGNRSTYFYKLTAEYDDGILGESGPSAATKVIMNADIGIGAVANTIDLTPVDTRYNMTKDVTKIHVYRTVRYGKTDSTYYRAGSVSCSSGTPSADFTDSVRDVDLVTNTILDEDRHLPPKYRTAAVWRDRLVIGNLKARDTSDDTELDQEAGGVHKNRIRFSLAFQPDIFKTDFFQDILPDGDSGSIKRLIVNPALDALLVLMENDVVALRGQPLGDLRSTLSFTPQNIANAQGTPAPYSAIYYDGRIFYVTKHGIEVIEGLRGRNITSHTIAPLWNQLDSNHPRYADRINMGALPAITAGIQVDERGEKIMWSYPAAASTFNTKTLVLHYDVWRARNFRGPAPITIDTNGYSVFEAWNGEGDRGELFGGEPNSGNAPWAYRVGVGNKDEGGAGVATTTEAVIVAHIQPGSTDAKRPDMQRMARAVYVQGKGSFSGGPSTRVVLKLDVDEEKILTTLDDFTWPNGVYPRREMRPAPRASIGVYHGIQFELVDVSSVGVYPGPFELYDYTLRVRDLPRRIRGST